MSSYEILGRVILSSQVSKKGELQTAVLSSAETHGLSLFHHELAADECVKDIAKILVKRARASSPDTSVAGVMLFDTHSVRYFCDETEDFPPYCVYDTALYENAYHAEVFQRVVDCPEVIRLNRRRGLFGVLKSKYIQAVNYRHGLLSGM